MEMRMASPMMPLVAYSLGAYCEYRVMCRGQGRLIKRSSTPRTLNGHQELCKASGCWHKNLSCKAAPVYLPNEDEQSEGRCNGLREDGRAVVLAMGCAEYVPICLPLCYQR